MATASSLTPPDGRRSSRPTGFLAVLLLGVVSAAAIAAAPAQASESAPATLGAALASKPTATGGGEDFLPVERAFRFEASADARAVHLNWQIADGYYLYRSRLHIEPQSHATDLGTPVLPTGQVKNDEYFGKQEIYHHELRITVPVAAGAQWPIALKVSFQGCAEAGLCYPPVTRVLQLSQGSPAAFAGPGAGGNSPAGHAAGGASAAAGAGTGAAHFVSEQDWFASLIRGGSWFAMLGGFYLAGLLLAFTPCVLPMVPILSGLIVGQGRGTTAGRGFILSLAYVLGMSITYTVAGAVCAAAGKQVQAVFQQGWILVLFAAVFVAMALSMFGLFTVQMPAAIQTRVTALSNRQSAGSLGGVAVMGALSALIVTTCVGPALVGALIVIGQTGQALRGAAALFVMSLGMGTPLLAVGASAGRLLPKAGPWMHTVKKLFGVLMLAVAAWMLARVVPARAILLLWAVPTATASWLLLRAVRAWTPQAALVRLAGAAAGVYALVLIAGAAAGSQDALAPWSAWSATHGTRELEFRSIKSVADLERAVQGAQASGRPVLLDFYADWCTSCREMERYTFRDPAVRSMLGNALLLRADVTRNDADDQALLRHFGIFGPPTIAFYDRDGRERSDYRVVGYMRADAFLARLKTALGLPAPALART